MTADDILAVWESRAGLPVHTEEPRHRLLCTFPPEQPVRQRYTSSVRCKQCLLKLLAMDANGDFDDCHYIAIRGPEVSVPVPTYVEALRRYLAMKGPVWL